MLPHSHDFSDMNEIELRFLTVCPMQMLQYELEPPYLQKKNHYKVTLHYDVVPYNAVNSHETITVDNPRLH